MSSSSNGSNQQGTSSSSRSHKSADKTNSASFLFFIFRDLYLNVHRTLAAWSRGLFWHLDFRFLVPSVRTGEEIFFRDTYERKNYIEPLLQKTRPVCKLTLRFLVPPVGNSGETTQELCWLGHPTFSRKISPFYTLIQPKIKVVEPSFRTLGIFFILPTLSSTHAHTQQGKLLHSLITNIKKNPKIFNGKTKKKSKNE